MVVTAGIDARTDGVKGFRLIVNGAQDAVILLIALDIPCFVERTPTDQRRVIVISCHCFCPFSEIILEIGGIGVIKSPVCVFTPDDITEFIGFIKETAFRLYTGRRFL